MAEPALDAIEMLMEAARLARLGFTASARIYANAALALIDEERRSA